MFKKVVDLEKILAQDPRPLLEKAGCTLDFREAVFEEQWNSGPHLVSLLRSNLVEEEREKEFRRFLARRSALIQGTDAGYLSFPHSPMNQICIQLAQAIAKPGESIVQILNPSVTIDHYIVITEDLIALTEENREFRPCRFILNQAGDAIIPLYPWFETQTRIDKPLVNQLHASGSKNPAEQDVPLSKEDIEQLRKSAMPASNDFFDEFVRRKNCTQGTLYAEVVKLRDGLYYHGAGYKGTVKEVHPDGFKFIGEFIGVLAKLTEEQRTQILQLKADSGHSFEYYWRILTDPSFDPAKDKRKKLETCVQINGSNLLAIANKHNQLFESLIITPKTAPSESQSFALLLESIADNISIREECLKKFMTEGPEDRVFFGEKALKLNYAGKSDLLTTRLPVYRWQLDPSMNGTGDIILTLDRFNHARSILSEIEVDLLLNSSTLESLQILHRQATRSNSEVADLIFRKPYFNPDPNILVQAAYKGEMKVIETYLAFNKPIDEPGTYGITPLGAAAKNGWKGIVELLLSKKVSVDGKTLDEPSPLQLASENGNDETAFLLIKAGAKFDPQTDGLKAMLTAASFGDDTTIDFLISKGVKLHVENDSKSTPLIEAVRCGHLSTTQKLLNHKVDIHQKDGRGNTALIHALKWERDEIALKLIKAGAETNLMVEGVPILYSALKNGCYQAAEEMIKRGLDVNAATPRGFSSLHASAADGNEVIAKWLIDHGAKLDLQNANGDTPLHLAASDNHIAVIQVLIENKASLDLKNNEKKTPLLRALFYRKDASASQLIKAGAQIIPEIEGSPILHYAIRYGLNLVIDELLERKIDLDANHIALHLAVGMRNWGAVDKLKKAGANVNLLDSSGNTAFALLTATVNCKQDIAVQYIAAGADISGNFGPDNDPILKYALKNNLMDVVDALLKHPLILSKLKTDPWTVPPTQLSKVTVEVLKIILTNDTKTDDFMEWMKRGLEHIIQDLGFFSERLKEMSLLLVEAGVPLRGFPFSPNEQNVFIAKLSALLASIPFVTAHRATIKRLILAGAASHWMTLEKMIEIGVKFTRDEMCSAGLRFSPGDSPGTLFEKTISLTDLYKLADFEMCSEMGVNLLAIYVLKRMDKYSQSYLDLQAALSQENLPECCRLIMNGQQGCLPLSWFSRPNPIWAQVPQELKDYIRREIMTQRTDHRVPGTNLIRMK